MLANHLISLGLNLSLSKGCLAWKRETLNCKMQAWTVQSGLHQIESILKQTELRNFSNVFGETARADCHSNKIKFNSEHGLDTV